MGKKPLEIDMIAGSQLRDTQGEMLSVEGADISDLESGKGRFNDNHGKGFFNSIGKVTGAKKILSLEDCTDPRHEYYWHKVKAPYIYVKGELYNGEDHPNARAAAAIMRNIHKSDSPLKIKASVEGGVTSRGLKDESFLARTKIHSIALTFTPANNATLCEPTSLTKGDYDYEADMQLMKSVMHLAKTDIPSFRSVTRNAQAEKIYDNFLKMNELAKSLGLKTELQLPNSPEELIKGALEEKIKSNIEKINELIKAMSPDDSPHRSVEPGKSFKVGSGKASFMGREHNEGNPNSDEDEHLDHWVLSHPDHNERTHVFIHNMVAAKGGYHSTVSSVAPYTYEQLHEHKQEVNANYENSGDFEGVKAEAHKMSNKFSSHFKEMYPTLMSNDDHEGAFDLSEEPKPGLKLVKEEGLGKALTAGYGGAGAPTSLTGGGVMQSEAIDDGRSKNKKKGKGFKYMNCKNCGHEQVYMKHQVKCRDCNKHASLEDLYRLMVDE